jgi:hypothetical protein
MPPPINRLSRTRPVPIRARPVPDAVARPVPDEVLRQLADLARVPALVDLFAELLQPYYGIPPTPLHEVLHEAAKRAGWAPLLHLQRLSILSGLPPAAELFSANRTWRSVGYWSRTCSNNCGLASRQRLVQREPLRQSSAGLKRYRLTECRL